MVEMACGNQIVCLTYKQITALVPMIRQWYKEGIFVHFIRLEHMNANCSIKEDSKYPCIKVIFITADLEQAARNIINQYNEHFNPEVNPDIASIPCGIVLLGN